MAHHPNVEHLLHLLCADPLDPTPLLLGQQVPTAVGVQLRQLREIRGKFRDMAESMCSTLTDSPETSAGLRKLLEARDCFLRAAMAEDD